MNSALNSPAYPERRLHWLRPLAFGAWAAAIAIAPSFTTKAVLAAPAALAPLLWWTLYKPARWLALFFAAALLLPPLPIPIGDSGPHPCLIFATLGLFAGWLRFADWQIRPSELTAAFTALFGILLASVAASAVY